MPGLGARLGRGGATLTEQDLLNSDCVVVMGSNMAENHPIAFRFAIKAREQGARLIHIDPRFSRTSAMADTYVRIRSGTDIAFLGGIINYILEHDLWFKDYVLAYTNASTLIDERYLGPEDLDGMFSGFEPERRAYDNETWRHRQRPDDDQPQEDTAEKTGIGALKEPAQPLRDETLQDPFCVLQIVKRHYARYTPEMVSDICGCTPEELIAVARALAENSNPERTSAFCYAMGWAQHTVGVQMIGAATLLQLLLGNIGRPGGGILALRGHATIQGSTDIPTLYNLLPGYLPHPSTASGHRDFASYVQANTPRGGWWANTPKYIVSLLKAWFGDAATAENDYMFDAIPKIDKDYSVLPMINAMGDGTIKGLFCMGQNPAVGAQDASLVRRNLAQLEWLVVRDGFEVETATFWKHSPEIHDGTLVTEQIGTEVFLLPSCFSVEKDGSYTNTHRLVQFHDKAVDAPGDARTEAWFMVHLGRRLRELYAGSTRQSDQGVLKLVWDYSTEGPHDEPVIDEIDKEINGWTVADRKPVPDFMALKDDGSTASGCWLYSGIYPEEGRNLARARHGDDSTSLGWGFAWPANRRLLYNRASARPDGTPWSERKKYLWWNAETGAWDGPDVPDFPKDKAPDTPAAPNGTGVDAHSGADPFIVMPDGRAWLFVPGGMLDGPLPTHYEPIEGPEQNALYSQQSNPTAKNWQRDGKLIKRGDSAYPYVLTTYRLTEHHTAGGMSRFLPWLAELQPAVFVEISPELANELGITDGDDVQVETPRGHASGRAMVTERMQPMKLRRRTVHQVGIPWHFGYEGLVRGDAANNLTALVGDPNVSIHESKALMCRIRKV